MKSVLGISFACLMLGMFVLWSSTVGTVASVSETGALYGGACTQDAQGSKVNVCYGGSCSGGGCGCAERMPWTTGQTGAKPDPAASCGTSYCTARQTISGTCAAGG